MNLRDLKYLVALADHRHFRKAAEACFVTQPALSMQIKKLEEYLDVQLIERNNKSVMLTPNGAILAERARLIINHVEELKQAARSLNDPESGEVKLGIIPTLAPYLLPHIMNPIAHQFPNVHLYLLEEKTHELLQKLKEGKIDAALLALPVNEAGMHHSLLFEEEFLLAVPKQHPLSKRKMIKQTELTHHTLLLLEEGHCLRDQALDVCKANHVNEAEGFRATSLETLRHMVSSGMGATIIPKLAAKKDDQLVYLAFNHPKPSRLVGLVWRKSSPKTKLFQGISEVVKRTVF